MPNRESNRTTERDPYQSLRQAIVKADADPLRPTYHFGPPANWMNDPNGPLFHEGYLHVFYQFNPYSDSWDHMHWGHACTRDFVHWEHLPIALFPQQQFLEHHCFSGCCIAGDRDEPIIIYTSVHSNESGIPNAQRIAVGTPDLIEWRQREEPLLSANDIPFPIRSDWRDPFVFRYGEKTFLIVSAMGADPEGESAVLAFTAEDSSLLSWRYLGPVFETGQDYKFLECPNFVTIGGRSVLIFSPVKPVEYRTGSFDVESGRLSADQAGIVDRSTDFYATNVVTDDNGRVIMLAWIRHFPGRRGWNGCLAIPRELSLDSSGHLLQKPVDELNDLREHHKAIPPEQLRRDSPAFNDSTQQSRHIRAERESRSAFEAVCLACTRL